MKKTEENKQTDLADQQTAKDSESNSTTSQTKRRTLIASIAAAGAGGLPTVWKKPVVDHILLPAHAEMSIGSGTVPGGGTMTETMATTATASLSESFAGFATCEVNAATAYMATGSFASSASYSKTAATACTDPLGNITSAALFSSYFASISATNSAGISSFFGSYVQDGSSAASTYSSSFTITVTI